MQHMPHAADYRHLELALHLRNHERPVEAVVAHILNDQDEPDGQEWLKGIVGRDGIVDRESPGNSAQSLLVAADADAIRISQNTD
ncbi:hypothetical protein C8J57DRAFT_1528437 [Mycena rebaudengoi]|nr:hypothetical protein C8J57DRAFT_1528437 [Mycena rebaudengoi]